jgi:hypothetical protein
LGWGVTTLNTELMNERSSRDFFFLDTYWSMQSKADNEAEDGALAHVWCDHCSM